MSLMRSFSPLQMRCFSAGPNWQFLQCSWDLKASLLFSNCFFLFAFSSLRVYFTLLAYEDSGLCAVYLGWLPFFVLAFEPTIFIFSVMRQASRMDLASLRYYRWSSISSAISNMVGGLCSLLRLPLVYIRYYIMIYSTRTGKPGAPRDTDSGSKKSKDSSTVKSKPRIHTISQTELKMREGINTKFEKSKIKNYQYVPIANGTHLTYAKNSENSSEDSSKMVDFSFLLGLRFINLKECRSQTPFQSQKKNITRMPLSENKKTIKTQDNIRYSSKLYFEPHHKHQNLQPKDPTFTKSKHRFNPKKERNRTGTVYSGDKNEHLRLENHSGPKYDEFDKKYSPLQQYPKSKLQLLRKFKKSPAHHYL